MLGFIGVVCIIVGYFASIITMARVSADIYKKGYEDGKNQTLNKYRDDVK